ncbi:DUF1353 domain-containing protein [Pseudomonas tohonis]|uniref:DUF1353 domain-containing protein n=1 Tax=Pseudomonas solani TaxID=2731552 RepID=UPI000396C0EC|nr:hypothetical protein L682_07260 [Pseudomonas alcaligenes OT 69]MDN4146612.1 DUF1353 domain-containing protein [Pseudomonas tohonis]
MPFKAALELRSLPELDAWETTMPLPYMTQDDRLVVVPTGYRTDLASVPRLAWRIVPRDHAQARRPAVVHDYIYTSQTHRFTKEEADRIFQQALIEEGMNRALAWLMWCAVRIGGRGNWGRI